MTTRLASLPPVLAALANPSREADVPVGLAELKDAQDTLRALIAETIEPTLLPGVFDANRTSRKILPADQSVGDMLHGLQTLAVLWENSALRPLLTARHLPLELAALLQALHAPPTDVGSQGCSQMGGIGEGGSLAWYRGRLSQLMANEPALALIEAFIVLLRQPAAPPWLRAACGSHLSQAVLCPTGVHSLLLSLRAHQGSEADRATACLYAVRTLSVVPSTMEVSAYIENLRAQLEPLLLGRPETEEDPGPGLAATVLATPTSAPTSAGQSEEGGARLAEAEAEAAHLQQVCASLVGSLARRYPEACDARLLRPMLAPIALLPGSAHRDAEKGAEGFVSALERMAALLTTSPPPPAKLCSLLLGADVLRPILRLTACAHWLHTCEGDTAASFLRAPRHETHGMTTLREDLEYVQLATRDGGRLVRLAERCVCSLLSLTAQTIPYLAKLLSEGAHKPVPAAGINTTWEGSDGGMSALCSYVARRLGQQSATRRAVAAVTARLLSGALRVLGTCEQASELPPEPAASASTADVQVLQGSLCAPTALTLDKPIVAAALLLLDGIDPRDLTSFLKDDPRPALQLLRATLPAALGLSAALVGEMEVVAAAAERLALCISVVQLLLPAAEVEGGRSDKGLDAADSAHDGAGGAGAAGDTGTSDRAKLGTADVSSLRHGLRELLPVLVAASNAPLLDKDTRAKALSASIGVATLAPSSGGIDDVTNGGINEKDAAEGRAALREAAEELGSPHVPLRAKGLGTLARLLRSRRPAVMINLPLVVDLCETQMQHEDSFVYQAAVNALQAAATVSPSMVLPRLASLLMPDEDLPARAPPAVSARSAPRHTREADTGTSSEELLHTGAERRLKAAQAICQAVLALGETLPPHAAAVMDALLIGACDAKHPAVRSSCLACLSEVAGTLRFALHPWAVELLHVTSAALEGETDAPARLAACRVVTLLLGSLGTSADTLRVLPAKQLATLYRRLRELRDGAIASGTEEALHDRAVEAVAQLDALGHELAKGSAANEQGDADCSRGFEGLTIDGLRIVAGPAERQRMDIRMPADSPRDSTLKQLVVDLSQTLTTCDTT